MAPVVYWVLSGQSWERFMIELIFESLKLGLVGSAGATLFIIIFKLLTGGS